MLYFLYGEDSYSAQKKAREIEADFIVRDGTDLNIEKVDVTKLTKDRFIGLISAMPFFGSGRLIVIKNLLIDGNNKEIEEYIAKNIANLSDCTTLILLELGVPDGRNGLYKKLKSLPESTYFPYLEGNRLYDWIGKKVQEFGQNVSRQVILQISQFFGQDLCRLENELGKICLYCKSQGKKEITKADLQVFGEPDENINIFKLTDSIGTKDLKASTLALFKLREQGESDLLIFSMIVSHLKKMLIIDDLFAKHQPVECSGFHPFLVKKIRSSLHHFKKNELKKVYFLLQNLDAKIKKGEIDASIALDKLVVDFCGF